MAYLHRTWAGSNVNRGDQWEENCTLKAVFRATAAKYTRNTLDCDQFNVYSSRAVFSAISQGLFRSSSLHRRSAGDPPHEISFESLSL